MRSWRHRKRPPARPRLSVAEVLADLCDHLRPSLDAGLAAGLVVTEAWSDYGWGVQLSGLVPAPPVCAAVVPVQSNALDWMPYAFHCVEHDQWLGWRPGRPTDPPSEAHLTAFEQERRALGL